MANPNKTVQSWRQKQLQKTSKVKALPPQEMERLSKTDVPPVTQETLDEHRAWLESLGLKVPETVNDLYTRAEEQDEMDRAAMEDLGLKVPETPDGLKEMK